MKAGKYIALALALIVVGFAAMTISNGSRCNESRVHEISEELSSNLPRTGTSEEILEALEDEHGINCHGAQLLNGTLRCRVATQCGFGAAMEANIDIHVRKVDGGWSIVP